MDRLNPFSLDSLSLAGSPYQWAIAGVIVLAVFAPRLLPPLARMLGMEARRRIGLPAQRREKSNRPQQATIVEIIPPQPVIRARESIQPPLTVKSYPPSRRFWLAGSVVSAILAVMLWYLLHSR